MGKKNKKKQITVKEEEIDLVKLFSLIGNAFSNLFKFIGKILKGIFHYFVLLLILIKEHFIKILSAIILGSILGSLIDSKIPEKYNYDMIIEPNYGSIHQLFEKIEYYNVLIKEKDSLALHKEFNISYKEANSLVDFEIIPYETKKDQVLAYNEFIENLDTLTHQHFLFKDFIRDDVSKFNSKRYVYRIISTINNLTFFGDKILNKIKENPILQKKKRIKLQLLKTDSIFIKEALSEVDSLRSLYKKVTLLEVRNNKPSTGTFLDFSKKTESNNNDIKLFNVKEQLGEKLIEIEKEKGASTDVISVITKSNPVGTNRHKKSYMLILGGIFGVLIILFASLKKINIYLTNYKNKNTY